jgi:hypothetical protein
MDKAEGRRHFIAGAAGYIGEGQVLVRAEGAKQGAGAVHGGKPLDGHGVCDYYKYFLGMQVSVCRQTLERDCGEFGPSRKSV